ncbi:MAG: outer membrane lipoprotein LolB [Arenimonas sp.]
MRLLCLCALLALGACRSVPERGVPAPSMAGREALLADQTAWGFTGRVAYSQAGQGGSARIDWQQTGAVSEVRLSGPLAAGSVRLRVEGGQAQVFDAADNVLAEGETDAVFGQWLAAPLPAADLAAGLRAYWPDSPERTAAALSGSVRSRGWEWRYSAWWPGPATLPKQLEVQGGDARLRVVIDQWRESGGD